MRTRADQIFERFCRFHRANPLVWTLVQRFTRELIDAGHAHYSVYAVFHRIRWHVNIETRSDDEMKLGNNYGPYYARLYHLAFPEHDGFFDTRYLTTQDRPAHTEDLPFTFGEPPRDEGWMTEQLRELLKDTDNGVKPCQPT